jgi:hypothetical protein
MKGANQKLYRRGFLNSRRGVAIPYQDSLSRSETMVNVGIWSRGLLLSESTRCQEAIGGVRFTNSEEKEP